MQFTAALIALSATSAAAFAPATFGRVTTNLDANIVDTIAALEGPGQVWGAEGIAVGKEESDFRGSDGFGLFAARLASTGVADTLKGDGPFTVFAPTDTAVIAFEKANGEMTADVIKYCVVEGKLSASAVSSQPLVSLAGPSLVYSRKFRKDFVNDAIIGEKTFGPFADFPTGVDCDNGIVHSVGIALDPTFAVINAETGLSGAR
uniref:FAS1 domain-containing protein n=1 Tax=Attheya septentrionalis TaxID=420275 RepID=A0A6T7GTB2_9STRA|mmetsp:Transcript_17279/g.31205  ORF Transcript_17279/g.31205 Transcript_17279/m.31205 type:complete len:205 (+) Transcript_17279:36-650(+)